MKREPRLPNLKSEYIANKIKIWKRAKITDTNAMKMLRLWLGYEFLDLMDESGRINVCYFNEVRRRLNYSNTTDLLKYTRQTESFYIVGTSEKNITHIYSPVWHDYETKDGMLLLGSSKVRNTIINPDALYNRDNIYNKTTVGYSSEFRLDGGDQEKARKSIDISTMECEEAKRIVREYFRWLETNSNPVQQAILGDLLSFCMNPRDKKGQIIETLVVDQERGIELMRYTIETELVPYFAKRQDFFKPTYMDNPDTRQHWMRNFIRKYSHSMIAKARKGLEKKHLALVAAETQKQHQNEKQNRPISPHEWQSSDGRRWYEDEDGRQMPIPENAPPRPSTEDEWDFVDKEWKR